MSIDVQTPDGGTASFPDGTSADVIKGALSKKFGTNVPRETPAPAPAAPQESTTEGLVRAAATGVPVVGGVMNKLDAATNALLAPLLDRYLPDNMEKLPEGSFGERYQHALDIQNRKDTTFGQEHPVLQAAGEIAGGLGSTGAALKAAPALTSRVLGLDAPTLPGQIVKGAAGGAALGAADAATRGQDVDSSAEIGAITGAAAPVAGRAVGRAIEAVRGLRRPPEIPQNVTNIAGAPVRQSLGQATGDTEAIQREQMALRGADNTQEQNVARDFFDRQKDELAAARGAIANRVGSGATVAETPQDAASIIADSLGQREQARYQTQQAGAQRLAADTDALHASLSPTGSVLASDPTEAANIISGAVSNAAERAQAATRDAYAKLRTLPGRFHPAAFNGAADEIRAALNRGTEPIRVDPQTTPIANNALNDLDEILGGRTTAPQMGGLAQTRDPATGRIEAKPPITPQVVEDTRKRLNSFYGDALAKARTGDRADLRAMRGVMDSFDDLVTNRLTDGRFQGGNPEDVASTLRFARGMNTAYRKTFTPQGAGDEVGSAIQKIVGRYEGQAAPPEQIRSMLYGNGALPVKLAQRLVNVFGADSPEVGAIKQGLFSHLTQQPGGLGPFAPAKAADNIDKFLKDSTLAQIYLSPAERTRLGQHAAALRASVPREAGPTDRLVARIGGASGEVPASPTDVVHMLMTTKGVGRTVALAQRIKTEFGEGSREWAALKQGLWAKLNESAGGPLDVGSKKVVNALTEFLDKDGKPLSHVVFTSDERDLIRSYRDLLDRITPPAGTVNYSNTSSVLNKMFRGALDGLFGLGGLHVAGPLGMAGAYAADVGQRAVRDTIRATKVAKSLYGTPQSARAMADLAASLSRLSSITARGATPALASGGR